MIWTPYKTDDAIYRAQCRLARYGVIGHPVGYWPAQYERDLRLVRALPTPPEAE